MSDQTNTNEGTDNNNNNNMLADSIVPLAPPIPENLNQTHRESNENAKSKQNENIIMDALVSIIIIFFF